jgi:hypothetical protein
MKEIPDIKFYQYDFSGVFREENDLNPSYNKWVADPTKGEAYTKQTLSQLFASAGSSGMIPSIREVIRENITGVMLFVPRTAATTRDEIMEPIMSQIRDSVGVGYHVIELTGRTTSGEEAEEYTKEHIEYANSCNKIPLIVCAGHIGSRSFSIPEINVVILMYDGGSAATTGQNMSRGSTRGQRTDKTSHVISISVDPTRDDSMIESVLETAVKVAEETGEDIIKATKKVLRSMNVHAIGSCGDMIPVNPDDYTAKIMNSRNLSKVVGATSKPELVMNDAESIQKILGMIGENVSLGKAATIGKKGKTYAQKDIGNSRQKNKEDRDVLSLWNKLKEAMRLIGDNAHNIASIANSDKFTTSISAISKSNDLTELFKDNFNIEPSFIRELVNTGVVNGKLLDLVVYTYNNEQIKKSNEFLR